MGWFARTTVGLLMVAAVWLAATGYWVPAVFLLVVAAFFPIAEWVIDQDRDIEAAGGDLRPTLDRGRPRRGRDRRG